MIMNCMESMPFFIMHTVHAAVFGMVLVAVTVVAFIICVDRTNRLIVGVTAPELCEIVRSGRFSGGINQEQPTTRNPTFFPRSSFTNPVVKREFRWLRFCLLQTDGQDSSTRSTLPSKVRELSNWTKKIRRKFGSLFYTVGVSI